MRHGGNPPWVYDLSSLCKIAVNVCPVPLHTQRTRRSGNRPRVQMTEKVVNGQIMWVRGVFLFHSFFFLFSFSTKTFGIPCISGCVHCTCEGMAKVTVVVKGVQRHILKILSHSRWPYLEQVRFYGRRRTLLIKIVFEALNFWSHSLGHMFNAGLQHSAWLRKDADQIQISRLLERYLWQSNDVIGRSWQHFGRIILKSLGGYPQMLRSGSASRTFCKQKPTVFRRIDWEKEKLFILSLNKACGDLFEEFALWRHTAYQNILPDHSLIKLYVNIQVDWSGGSLNSPPRCDTQLVCCKHHLCCTTLSNDRRG